MNRIRVAGQTITSTNYATDRLFNFNPALVRQAAENFLASGVTDLELPEGFLDPNRKFPDTGIDEAAVRETMGGLPKETRIIGSYLGSGKLGADNAAYLEEKKRAIDRFVEYCPDLIYTMLHPPTVKFADPAAIRETVKTWAKLAEYAAARRPGFKCCLHNHFDSSCETAAQVRAYLEGIKEANLPFFTWGPDTGHSHGMGDAYLAVFEEYAFLIGDYFHIKARVPAFDQTHGGELYNPKRDIWGNKAERGRGLYSGFVNVADPEIQTPFREVFAIMRAKARPSNGVITGAVEIDNPRQHPRLEAMCSVMYLTTAHGLKTGLNLSCDEIVQRVFAR